MAMIIAASCSKSKEKPKDETSSCQVTEKTSSNGTVSYSYHSDGKLAATKEGVYQETYTYAPTSMIWKFIEPSGNTYTTTYTLDAQGMVKTSFDGAVNNTFSYDGNGYLIEVRGEALWVGILKYTWTNGNLTKIEQTRGGSTNTTNLEYGIESRPMGFNADYASGGEFIWQDGDRQILASSSFGKQPKNLVSKITFNGGTSQYSYTKDANGNIAKVAVTGTNGTSIDYKYNCK